MIFNSPFLDLYLSNLFENFSCFFLSIGFQTILFLSLKVIILLTRNLTYLSNFLGMFLKEYFRFLVSFHELGYLVIQKLAYSLDFSHFLRLLLFIFNIQQWEIFHWTQINAKCVWNEILAKGNTSRDLFIVVIMLCISAFIWLIISLIRWVNWSFKSINQLIMGPRLNWAYEDEKFFVIN